MIALQSLVSKLPIKYGSNTVKTSFWVGINIAKGVGIGGPVDSKTILSKDNTSIK